MTIMVLEQGQSLYTWGIGLRYGDPENTVGLKVETSKAPFPLSAAYYPLANRLKVSVDTYDLAQREKVKSVHFEVTPQAGGAVLGRGDVTTFDYGQGFATLALPAAIKPGTYSCAASMLDAGGQVLASHQVTFERKDHAKEFPWIGNHIGEEDVVPRIFSPLAVKGDVLCGYAKEIRLAGSALPASIKAADIELLAAPIYLRGTAEGQKFLVEPVGNARKVTASPTHAIYTGRAAGGPLTAGVNYRLDYDGTAKVVLTLAPVKKDVPAKLDGLQLVIPFRAEAVTHFMVNGFNMRLSNHAGLLPGNGKPGILWKSTEMPFQRMTVGSFVPIVHLGNLNSGLTWFADSDQGWWPSEKKPARKSCAPRTASSSWSATWRASRSSCASLLRSSSACARCRYAK